VADVANVDCALCQQLSKRTLLLLLFINDLGVMFDNIRTWYKTDQYKPKSCSVRFCLAHRRPIEIYTIWSELGLVWAISQSVASL